MRFQTFASSSAGNAALLSCGETHILIDTGISCRRIQTALRQLGLSLRDLSAVLITHTHTDHIAGLATLIKACQVPVYCSEETGRQLRYRLAGVERVLTTFPLGGETAVGGCRITSVPTSHDSPGSTGFRVDEAEGSLGYLTDTGVLPDAAECLLGVDLLVLEANHDVETLRSGPYPYCLKRRVLGPQGHLSNDDAARFARQSAEAGTGGIILAHLSRENNTPQMALRTVGTALSSVGYTGTLSAAPRGEAGPIYTVGGEAEPC
jgi:phosphoribosyl 1,2-cyclic phosphodiesterase